jgi:hypothetical protein
LGIVKIRSVGAAPRAAVIGSPLLGGTPALLGARVPCRDDRI